MPRIVYQHGSASPFLDRPRLGQIHETALRILREIGLAVSAPQVLQQMAAQGLRIAGERILFEPQVVEAYLEERRQRYDRGGPPSQVPDGGAICLTTGVYAHHVHNLDMDRVEPYTTAKLIEMTRLVDVLTERGVHSPAPGYPLDVPAPLQPLMQYRVGATYARHGMRPVDPVSLAAVPYVMEMAEVLGHPLRNLPVYVFTPLRLAGESLAVALRYRARLAHISISAMPSLGGSAPILSLGAMALAVAEVLGAAVTLQMVTGLPTDFRANLYAFDPRQGSMVFGSPEAYLLGQLNAEVNAFYSPWRETARGRAAAEIHTRANFPGAQAAAEKAGLMTAGALVGVRAFDGAGTLALDEVFSAEQLLVDLEIRDQVQRLVAGLEMGDQGYDWLQEIRDGLQQGVMLGLESTVAHYRQVYWRPQLFERGFRATDAGRLKLAYEAREQVAAYVARHTYELDALRRQALERIWERAVRDLA